MQNYPNPFNPTTTIVYTLPKQQHVTLKVYDLMGREMVTLVDEAQDAGRYDIIFDATQLPSGTYFYRLLTEEVSLTEKLTLMK